MIICFVTNEDISRHATMKRAFGLAKPLKNAGHEVFVILEEHPENRLRAQANPEFTALYYDPSRWLMIHLWRKWRLLWKLKPDLVHICGLGYRNFLPSFCLPHACFIMDHAELESHMPGHSWVRRRLMGLLEWISFSHYRAQIAASRYLHAHIHRRGGAAGSVLYLPFAAENLESVASGRWADFKAKQGGRKVALYLGGLYRGYGVWEMLEAARILSRTRADLLFLLLGKGPEMDALAAEVKALGMSEAFILAGYVPESELPEALSLADLFIAPLHDTVVDWARCPSKLFIYMEQRRPIVTGPYGEAPLYLGTKGYYYRGGAAALAEAIASALDSTAKEVHYDYPTGWDQRCREYLNWLATLPALSLPCPTR